MSANPTDPNMLTVAEVAGVLRLSRPRVYELIGQGVIPCVRISQRRIRIPRRAWEAWLQAREYEAIESLERPADG